MATKKEAPQKRVPKKNGRPSKKTPEVVDEIINRLAAGESLAAICFDEHMPNPHTVHSWLAVDDALVKRYNDAREEQAELHHAAMDDIEEAVLSGKLNPKAAGVVLANKRWRMEKLKPRAYGARITQELSGPNGSAIQTEDLTKRDADEFTSRIARLAANVATSDGAGEADT